MILALMLACDPALWAHTYKHERFTVISRCALFSGMLVSCRPEKDGDFHCLLRLDPGQGHPLTSGNMTHQRGILVVEPICERIPSQKDAIGPCGGARAVVVPSAGGHVSVRGVYAIDKTHGWAEIHGAEFGGQ